MVADPSGVGESTPQQQRRHEGVAGLPAERPPPLARRLLRPRILRDVAAWAEKAQALDAQFQRRLRDTATDLHALLAAL